jgi:hypothetical protein
MSDPVNLPERRATGRLVAWRGIAVALLAGVCWTIEAMPVALADAAAGRAAFEKGNYARAMSEWQSAADRGDPDGELGLGTLYELGVGALAQDYKRADYWYEKAAEHHNSEAQYRLALIWSAGIDDFVPDPVEAYKWIILASQTQGVWGGLASEVKVQLDKVVDARQRAEAEKRVAVWKEAHLATKPEPSNSSPPPASAPSAAASSASAAAPSPSKPATGGCPGWPFPTLPCTEEFPSLGGASGPPHAPSSLLKPPVGPR